MKKFFFKRKNSVMMKESGISVYINVEVRMISFIELCTIVNCKLSLFCFSLSYLEMLPVELITSRSVSKYTWCIAKWKIQRAAKEAGH